MQQVLIGTILSISGVFMALTILIVANKAWREGRASMQGRRRKELEPKVLAWAHGDEKTVRRVLDGQPSSSDLVVLEQIMLDHIQRVRGIDWVRNLREA